MDARLRSCFWHLVSLQWFPLHQLTVSTCVRQRLVSYMHHSPSRSAPVEAWGSAVGSPWHISIAFWNRPSLYPPYATTPKHTSQATIAAVFEAKTLTSFDSPMMGARMTWITINCSNLACGSLRYRYAGSSLLSSSSPNDCHACTIHEPPRRWHTARSGARTKVSSTSSSRCAPSVADPVCAVRDLHTRHTPVPC